MKKKHKKFAIFLLIALIILIVRYFLSLQRYNRDILNHAAWTKSALEKGLKGYYNRNYSPWAKANYPPLANMFFYLSHKLYLILGFQGGVNNLLAAFYKLPLIIADVIIAFLFLNVAAEEKGFKKFLYPFLFLLNIALLYNSVFWGQLESLMTMFCMLALIFIFSKGKTLSFIFYALALLVKQTAFIFAPVFLILVIKKMSIKKIIFGSLITYLVLLLFFLPFAEKFHILYPIKFYIKTSGGQRHQTQATVNAFNFWFLMGLNKISDAKRFLSFDLRTISLAANAVIISPILVLLLKRKQDKKSVFKATGLVFYTVFLFLTRMHERHLYPALAFIIPGVNSILDFIVYVIISGVHFLNMDFVWAEMMAEPTASTILKGKLMALVTLVSFFYFYISFLYENYKREEL